MISDKSQGSVTAPSSCGLFSYHSTVCLWLSLVVKEILKSLNAFVMLLHRLFLTSTNIKQVIFYNFTQWFAALSHWAWQFSNTEISQGSVATRLRCGRMLNNDCIANLPMSLPVKEVWKLVSIGEVTDISLVPCFLVHSVQYDTVENI